MHAFMEELLGGEGRVYRGTRASASTSATSATTSTISTGSPRTYATSATGSSRSAPFAPEDGAVAPRSRRRYGVLADYEDGIAIRVWSTGDPSEALEAAGLSE